MTDFEVPRPNYLLNKQYVDPINLDLFSLGDLSTLQARDITESIVSFSTSLSLSGSSQISVGVIDPDFAFARANYFQIRRDIFYRNLWFEISAVETQRSESVHPLYTLECRSKGVQLMKRDKKPEAYRGMSAFEFAKKVAKDFKLNFFGEQTTKKQSVVKGKSKDSDDSVWTVLQSLAAEQQFVCFESEGTLFFCSEKFLIGKWGDENYKFGDAKFIPFFYPETTDPVFLPAADKYVLLDQPTIRRSDDDIRAAEGSMLVDRLNGVNLRPGMTIYLGGIPDFESFYLITDVSFTEGVPDPVQVSFRVPVDPKKEKVSTNGTKATTTTTGGARGTNPVGSAPGQTPPGAQPPTTRRLSITEASTYASQALAFINYKGSRGFLINEAVRKAVGALINKVPIAEIEKRINQTPSLNATEKKHVLTIYSYYALGLPASSLAVAGGIGTGVLDEKRQEVYDSFRPQTSNRTPDIETPRNQTELQAPGTLTQAMGGVISSADLPTPVRRAISDFFKTRATGLPQIEIDSTKNAALADALEIMRTPTTAGKISKYVTFYNRVGADPKVKKRLQQLRYLAIRLPSVYQGLDPKIKESDLQSAGASRLV